METTLKNIDAEIERLTRRARAIADEVESAGPRTAYTASDADLAIRTIRRVEAARAALVRVIEDCKRDVEGME